MSIQERFTQNLTDHFKENKKGLIPKCDYQKTIDALKAAGDNSHAKGRLGYYLLENTPEKLIKRRSTRQESPLYYVSIEETFDVVKSAHITTGHGGRDRLLKELQKKYANIPTKAVELFKSLCQECQKKRKQPMTKGVVVRPILTKEFSSRGQVDLIDMQNMPSGSNKKWIMVYQDHLTKFCILRALTSKRAAEVAFHLLDIFLLFGAPVILQSDNGSEFTSQVITELKEVWPKLTLVHGKPRHPQSKGLVERANGDIKYMLVAWMAYNDSQDWPTGIKFVQFQKKQCSPFRDKVLSIFCNVWL
ncbi:hypothetical protein Pmani_000907 [Petrolisthes manimaculis]|uniref:Integrase catalytic domain-containing protein n=1 Tax=Petrolisthes manimaculis TaxID=1843537 RepID=A0AAE1ULW4_9EUCA|nr:hypothetical protein Pmani_000907 [Petrolisthes manimaculis]